MSEESKLSFVRIAWEIAGREGHGEWHDMNKEPVLNNFVIAGNQKYGTGTHRLEYDDGQKAYDAAQDAIKRISSREPQALCLK